MPFNCYSKQYIEMIDKKAKYPTISLYPFACPIKCGQGRCVFTEWEYKCNRSYHMHHVCGLKFQPIRPFLIDRRTLVKTSKW